MENASRALLMAGGILIAMLVIGALMLMFNQLGAYQQNEGRNEKNSQLAEFNNEYLQYAETIYGYQFISLINRTVNYNQKQNDIGNDFPYQEIIVKVKLGNQFAKDFGVNNQLELFTSTDYYPIKNKSSEFYQDIDYCRSLEKQLSLSTMSKLSANYDNIERYIEIKNDSSLSESEKEIAIFNEIGQSTRQFIEKYINIASDFTKVIRQYREYSEFKKAQFKCTKEQYHNNGQIKELDFEYTK